VTNEKVIMLIEAKIQPQRRAELVEAAHQYLPLVRAEPGVEAFYLTDAKGRPQYVCFLRDLQVASRTGFPSATGLHQEILSDAKKRAGWGTSANKSGGIGCGSTSTL